ncbi:MAG: hypothetical protein FJ301_09660 [Planctomycetes bacterium]|nr:hypothetical protein [Planctomycetota bacterium]
MASSPAENAATPKAFALQELTACWNQAYEALVRGDLDRVTALLDIIDDHVATAGDSRTDTANEQQLRATAMGANGRLEHAMRAGLQGMRDEMERARVGGKALRGYAQATPRTDDSVFRNA